MKDVNTYNEDLENNNLPASLRVNPFVVQDNFFDDQQKAILNQIGIENKVLNSKPQSESIPPNYFEGLENSILARIAESNLKEIVSETGFTTPTNYFENFNDHLLTKISESYLKEVIVEDGFDVPANYFENLEKDLEISIAEENLKTSIISDGFDVPSAYFEESLDLIMLTAKLDLPKESGLVSPQGYFDKLESNISKKITLSDKSETKVIKMPSSKGNWYKYGAAAITLIIGASSYLFLNKSDQSIDNSEIAYSQNVDLGNVSDDEILNYLAQVSEDDDLVQLTKIIDNQDASNQNDIKIDQDIENKEIEDYLNYML